MSAAEPLSQMPPPEQIRQATREIISRPEFAEPLPWREQLLTLMEQVREWLAGLSEWAADNPQTARLLFIIAVLLLIACLIHLVYLTVADILPSARRKAGAARQANWQILEGSAKNWRDAIDLARQLLAEGNIRRAVWIAHRVLLGLLDEQGAIKFAGWKTNSHYLGECARSHPWYATFSELTQVYESAIYASRGAPREAVEALVARIDQLAKGAPA